MAPGFGFVSCLAGEGAVRLDNSQQGSAVLNSGRCCNHHVVRKEKVRNRQQVRGNRESQKPAGDHLPVHHSRQDIRA